MRVFKYRIIAFNTFKTNWLTEEDFNIVYRELSKMFEEIYLDVERLPLYLGGLY